MTATESIKNDARKSWRATARDSIEYLKVWFRAWAGIPRYLAGGEAGHSSWSAFLNLHCRTNGRSTDSLTNVVRILARPRPFKPFSSMLGSFDKQRLDGIASQIEKDGYYVFDQRIPENLCDQIAAAALKIEAETEVIEAGGPIRRVYDPASPAAHRYSVAEEDIWRIPAFQQILADPIFINVAQAYLRATPAIANAQLWWSSVMGGRSSSAAAQLFHFDYDPAPRWLKFFVHMTDVDVGSGPHVFVKGSHKSGNPKAKEVLSRGYVRVADEQIEAIYGQENVVEFTGRRGTVLVVDTLGFHKGKPPLSQHRLIGQLVLSTPLFVPTRSQPLRIPENASAELIKTRMDYPWSFARYPISGQ